MAASKLTLTQAKQILAALRRGVQQKVLAAQYGVTQSNISFINRGYSWKRARSVSCSPTAGWPDTRNRRPQWKPHSRHPQASSPGLPLRPS